MRNVVEPPSSAPIGRAAAARQNAEHLATAFMLGVGARFSNLLADDLRVSPQAKRRQGRRTHPAAVGLLLCILLLAVLGSLLRG